MWKLLLSLLLPGIDDDEAVAEPDDEAVAEPDDDEPAPRETRAQRDIRELRARSQRAEEDLVKAKADLEAARRQPAAAAQPTEMQRLWEQGEAVLRDPNTEPWQKYAVEAKREARMSRMDSQSAMMRAEDLADRTRFEQLKVTKPKVYEQYAEKVEKALDELRAQGKSAPREALLAYQLGQDMLSGKLSTKSTSKPSAARGQPISARSDVSSSGSGRMSEAEKRVKRLENVRI